jgi:hypothetical protein
LVTTSHRIGKNLRSYLAMAVYLYACFGSLLRYKAMLLHDRRVDYAPHGLAAGKALLLAKFVLMGAKCSLGRKSAAPAAYCRYMRVVGSFLLTIGLSVIQEATVGLFHDRLVRDTLVRLGHGRSGEIIATSLVPFVTLIPYFAYQEIDTMPCEGKLLEMLRRGSSLCV